MKTKAELKENAEGTVVKLRIVLSTLTKSSFVGILMVFRSWSYTGKMICARGRMLI